MNLMHFTFHLCLEGRLEIIQPGLETGRLRVFLSQVMLLKELLKKINTPTAQATLRSKKWSLP